MGGQESVSHLREGEEGERQEKARHGCSTMLQAKTAFAEAPEIESATKSLFLLSDFHSGGRLEV